MNVDKEVLNSLFGVPEWEQRWVDSVIEAHTNDIIRRWDKEEQMTSTDPEDSLRNGTLSDEEKELFKDGITTKIGLSEDEITLTNAYCLLDELRMSYESSPLVLYAWASGKMDCIERTIMELEEILKEGAT